MKPYKCPMCGWTAPPDREGSEGRWLIVAIFLLMAGQVVAAIALGAMLAGGRS